MIAIRNASSASEGTVCSTATDRQQRWRSRRPAPGGDADRNAERDREPERSEHEEQMLAEQPAEVGCEHPIDQARARLPGRLSLRRRPRGCPAPSDEALGDLREAATVELDLRVERDHRRRVDAAFEAAQRRRVECRRASAGPPRSAGRTRGRPRARAGDSARPWRRSSRRRSRRPCRRRSRRRRDRGRARRRLRSADRTPPSARASRRRAAGTRATGRAAACRSAAEQGRRPC